MENQTAETATPSANQWQPRPATKRTSKWLKYGVPGVVIVLLAYTYHTGHLQQAVSYVKDVAGQASTGIAARVPGEHQATPQAQPVSVEDKAEDKLSAAREAFAAGDVNAAIAGYQAIIAKNPEDMVAQGELGNVFYTVGATKEAAQAYFETARLAIKQNKLEVAETLMPIVSEGNPMLADQLSDQLFDARKRTHMTRPDSSDQAWNRQQQSEQPRYGQQSGTQYGQSQYEQPPFEQPPFQQPQYGQPQFQQPQYGPQYGQSQFEQPPFEQPPFQQPQYGPQYGQPQFRQPG